MKLTTIIKKEFEIRDLGTEALELILDDSIDVDYELSYYNLLPSEKIIILQAIKKQFEQAIKEKINEISFDN